MEFIDTHCHLQDPPLVDAVDNVIARAHRKGVRGFMLAGVDPEDWERQLRLAQRYPECGISFGVHPQKVWQNPNNVDNMLAALVKYLEDSNQTRPLALGETGLDRSNSDARACMPEQRRIFIQQLHLAHRAELPVILHIRDAHGAALEILEREGVPERGGVVHSYSGSSELVAKYVALGLHLSFASPVTIPTAARVRAAAAAVPLERLLVETDAPYQTPRAHRPQPNEPQYLPETVDALAAVRCESADTIAATTTRNAQILFGYAFSPDG